LSSAFEGLHPAVQKAVQSTTGKTKSKDHFERRFMKDHIFEERSKIEGTSNQKLKEELCTYLR